MGSSESMDSGRISCQRSNFSHTCALLSQYLKEKGSFGDLSLDSVGKSDPERGPMTIFYNGQMMIFNDFPAEKAKEIVALAVNTQNPNILPYTEANSVVPRQAAAKVVSGFGNQRPYSDLPIARRSSLARFLEKRKDRITSKAPYQKSNEVGAAASKLEENKGWLGLGAQFAVKNEPQLYTV